MDEPMFDVRLILLFGALAGVLTAVALALLPWTRAWAGGRRRPVTAGLAAAAGFILWNLTLNATHSVGGFNVDAPIIPLSWADAGSGVIAFAATAFVLGLFTDRDEPAGRVVGAAAVAGVVTVLLDLVVL